MAGDVAHDPVVNPSIHYLGVEGATTLQDHAACIQQNARIMAERSDTYGDQGAYNFQMCNSHGIRFEGRGWGRDSAANGIGDYNGVNYNVGSRAMCVLVGTEDVITDVCRAGIVAFANEAITQHGMQWPLRGHSEFVATSCPGDHLRDVIAQVNQNPNAGDDFTVGNMDDIAQWEKDTRAVILKVLLGDINVNTDKGVLAGWEKDTRKIVTDAVAASEARILAAIAAKK